MVNLDKWLKNRTFHYNEFTDIKRLVELKERKGVTISLCFPTLNEEKTIGKSIVVMKSELMDRYPLVDEIAVIDSGSTDNTLSIAKNFGADTYLASDYLKSEGECRGKGENLWKALYLLKGDIIVYVDADISNIHPRFAYGLIGPLLMEPEVKFVKAFYNRPFKTSAGISPSGGGRVTEILIRPLFSQFFPDLTGVIQPLSGEYAGYREMLEKISFPIGYGVETGMLIDLYQKYGLDSIAQTNIDLRIHRNQTTASLGKMSFGILQTFWNRLKKYKDLPPIAPESFMLRQMAIDNDDYKVIEYDIREKERTPMIEVEDYLKKYHKKKK
ncbi:MAG: glucosyl-3-phosphoglycerate synthase [Lentisphaerae bacterium]|nr:glucosyl-3-phosphoglycerate synthase [Lentisphaerota bacterium]MCP4100636.1 glucosyl-3-phosphoglycerate synthase [Lentisphaerota bacterium]